MIFSSTVSWAELFPDFCIPMCEVFSMTGMSLPSTFQYPSFISKVLVFVVAFTGNTTLFIGWSRYPSLLLKSTAISTINCLNV